MIKQSVEHHETSDELISLQDVLCCLPAFRELIQPLCLSLTAQYKQFAFGGSSQMRTQSGLNWK
jgi:hypothetical protein